MFYLAMPYDNHVKTHRSVIQFMLVDVNQRCPQHPILLASSYPRQRISKSVRIGPFNLNKNQTILFSSYDIKLAAPDAVVLFNYFITTHPEIQRSYKFPSKSRSTTTTPY